MSGLLADTRAVLSGWVAPDDEQERLRLAYLEQLDARPDAIWRSCLPSHLTASVLVLDATGGQVLLTLHRKGKFWVQPGGHCEPGDRTLEAAALREGVEESGITGLQMVGSGPVHLDRHAITFGECGEHLDVRYAAVAPPGARHAVSEESDDVAWFPWDDLPPGVVEDVGGLVIAARTALLAQP
jgi:8-oxo-dGTP pyrophosphatase MutT (NUDIX family)